MKLTPHPRLYISQNHIDRLKVPAESTVLKRALRSVRRMANEFVDDPRIRVDETGHNYHLIRARRMQTRILTLLTAYRLTGKKTLRKTILEDVRVIAGWKYWSWITWRQDDARPSAIFDLSYGENSATLAIAYDLLCDELSESEHDLFVETARKRSLQPYLKQNGGRKKSWYYDSPNSNWNTVCNGGAGMLSLSMMERCPEAGRVLELVDQGVDPFFRSLDGDGGWPEGIGYWNYGMRYGFMYLLSHERATGRRHPLLKRKGTEATLSFPLTFTPNGQPCSFGDVNGFSPLPFHLAAAERFGRADLLNELDLRLQRDDQTDGTWPDQAETVLLHPRTIPKYVSGKSRSHHLLKGLDWGYVADRMPEPSVYVSVRGGTTDAPHVHRDLMSFHAVVGGEKLIENIPVQDYIDTTFSPRRFELYETSAGSKNTILINGVGVADKSTVITRKLEGRGYRGFRIDATDAMGSTYDGRVCDFCGRAILLLKSQVILVIDRVEVPHVALVESRMHTFHDVTFRADDATIRGKQNRMYVSYASTDPSLLKAGVGMQTHPQTDGDTILRRVSAGKVFQMTLCTLMVPGGKGSVAISERGKRTTIRTSGTVNSSVSFTTLGLHF
jgi:hypothetical protein